MVDQDKVRCRECDWKGKLSEVLKAADPFRAEESVIGCPECRGINSLYCCCDLQSCWKEAVCGFLETSGRRRDTCLKHGNNSLSVLRAIAHKLDL